MKFGARLSKIVNVPVYLIASVGVNFTAILQLAFGGKVACKFGMLVVGLEHFAAAIDLGRIRHHGSLKAFD